jgi:hypothetical protein
MSAGKRKRPVFVKAPWDTEVPPNVPPHHWSRQQPDGLAQYHGVDRETGELTSWRAPGPPIQELAPMRALPSLAVPKKSDPREGR